MTDVQVRLLGDIAVDRDGATVPVGTAALRTLLALLALDPGSPVPLDALFAQLWPDGDGPRHPAATIHTRMTRLRGWLGDQGLVTAHAGTYTLRLPPDAVDLVRFMAASQIALDVRASAVATLAAADAALALWAGDPLPAVQSPRLDAARARVHGRHALVAERRVQALLELDRVGEALDAVGPLADAQPVREPLQALRIEALHRAGDPREAVEAYLAACRALSAELGVGPGAELRAAYHRVVDERATAAGRRLRRPAMVGRDGDLERVLGALTEDGRIVVVEGEAGIGKSVLLAAARHAADGIGARVLAGAWQDDRSPMSAWFEALGWPPPPMEPAPGPWLRERLVDLARDAPLLVTLDDAHRADSGSLGVLTLLVRSGVPAGVVVLVAARSPDAVARPEWDAACAELGRADQTLSVPLDVLDQESIAGIATTRLGHLGPRSAARLAGVVAHRSGGHPLHAAALLDVLTAHPDESSALTAVQGVPARLRGMLEQQVARLPTAGRSALEALAVLAPIDLAGLAAVLGRHPLALAEELRPAVDAGLAVTLPDRVLLRHDLTADAARDAVPAVTRTELHRTRLDQLEPEVDAFVRLRHTLGAASVIPAADVARAQRAAGIEGYRRRALVEALGLLDAAATVLVDDAALDVHRGLVLGALGRREESDDVLEGVVDALLGRLHAEQDAARPDTTTAELLVLAAVGDETLGASVVGDPRRKARLDRVEQLDLPPGPRFELLAGVVREEALDGGSRPDAVAEMRQLAGAPGAPLTRRARARALEVRSLVEGPAPAGERLTDAEDAYALAAETGDPLLRLDATELLMTASLGAGRVQRTRTLQADLAVEAARWHRPRLIWASHLVGSALMLAEGDVEGADAAASAGLARGQELGVADAAQGFGVHLMIRHWLEGTADELVALTAGAAAAAASIPAWSAGAAVASARAGRLDDAAGYLAGFRARRGAVTGRLFDRPGLCMAAAAAFCVGDRVTARLVLVELPADPEAIVIVGYGAVVVGPATMFTGLASWALGDLDAARDGFVAAGALAAMLGWAPWAEAALRLEKALDAPDPVELPLGLVAPGSADVPDA